MRTNKSVENNPIDEAGSESLEPSAWSDRSASLEAVLDESAANVFEAVGLKKDFDDGAVQALRSLDLQIPKENLSPSPAQAAVARLHCFSYWVRWIGLLLVL